MAIIVEKNYKCEYFFLLWQWLKYFLGIDYKFILIKAVQCSVFFNREYEELSDVVTGKDNSA